MNVIGEIGASFSTSSVVLGNQLGLYKALTKAPATSSELASQTDTTDRYSMSVEQIPALTDSASAA